MALHLACTNRDLLETYYSETSVSLPGISVFYYAKVWIISKTFYSLVYNRIIVYYRILQYKIIIYIFALSLSGFFYWTVRVSAKSPRLDQYLALSSSTSRALPPSFFLVFFCGRHSLKSRCATRDSNLSAFWMENFVVTVNNKSQGYLHYAANSRNISRWQLPHFFNFLVFLAFISNFFFQILLF